LHLGEKLRSKNGFHALVMQKDGNLVLQSLGQPVWASGTTDKNVEKVRMQRDGNLVIYDSKGDAVWSSGTNGEGESNLFVQRDRNVVIYRENDDKPMWATNSNTPPECWDMHEFKTTKKAMVALKADPVACLFMSGGGAIGVACTATPQGVVICVAAAVVIAILIESMKDKPWGRGNEIRVLGGKLSDAAKQSGREFNDWARDQPDKVEEFFSDVFGW
jgi:hypothetical protein